MKRILSVLLALICLFSVVAVVAHAEDIDLKDVIREEMGLEPEEEKIYAIEFHQGDAQIMYRVPTQVRFDGPGYVRLTKDEPVAVGKNFRCWKDVNGKDVYPGQEILVDHLIELTADWSVATTKITDRLKRFNKNSTAQLEERAVRFSFPFFTSDHRSAC